MGTCGFHSRRFCGRDARLLMYEAPNSSWNDLGDPLTRPDVAPEADASGQDQRKSGIRRFCLGASLS
jgi:hypothetical protein